MASVLTATFLKTRNNDKLQFEFVTNLFFNDDKGDSQKYKFLFVRLVSVL